MELTNNRSRRGFCRASRCLWRGGCDGHQQCMREPAAQAAAGVATAVAADSAVSSGRIDSVCEHA